MQMIRARGERDVIKITPSYGTIRRIQDGVYYRILSVNKVTGRPYEYCCFAWGGGRKYLGESWQKQVLLLGEKFRKKSREASKIDAFAVLLPVCTSVVPNPLLPMYKLWTSRRKRRDNVSHNLPLLVKSTNLGQRKTSQSAPWRPRP